MAPATRSPKKSTSVKKVAKSPKKQSSAKKTTKTASATKSPKTKPLSSSPKKTVRVSKKTTPKKYQVAAVSPGTKNIETSITAQKQTGFIGSISAWISSIFGGH